jgi:hypothetical protein
MRDLHKRLMMDPEVRRECDALEEEFALILEVAKARQRARLGWNDVARRMKTTRRTNRRYSPPGSVQYFRPDGEVAEARS